jgi:periplasmic copper chaperone A
LVSSTALFCLASTATAHVVLQEQTAAADSTYKAVFKVGHGCSGSPTRQITVVIPAGVKSVKPMPKAGWVLELAAPKADAPQRVSWTAKSPADMLQSTHYDEFTLVAKLPTQVGAMYWPVEQLCEAGRNDWIDIPTTGQTLKDLKAPAALLTVQPAPATAGAGHVH